MLADLGCDDQLLAAQQARIAADIGDDLDVGITLGVALDEASDCG